MTFRHIALRNIGQNWHRYGAYLLSCVFSVMIFYVYLSFILHPDVESNRLPEGSTVSTLLVLCEILIFLFSIFFIWYSNIAFMSSRKREYGLFSLFGMSKWQLRRMVFEEQLIISLLSIVMGISAGMMVTKLFYMVLGSMLSLNEPLAFYISVRAIIITSALFMMLFISITLISMFKVGRTQIIHLIRIQQAVKREPKFSWVLAIFGLVSVILGYTYAVKTDLVTISRTAFPTFFWTIVGTYFLCTQFSILFIRLLTRRKSFYYHGTNLLNISKAAYRIRDNARMLFSIAILCTVVMSATATVFVYNKGYQNLILSQNPFELTVQQPFTEDVPITSERIHELAKEHGVTVSGEAKITLIKGETGETEGSTYPVSLINTSDYNRLAALLGKERITPFHEGIYLLTQGQYELAFYSDLNQDFENEVMKITIGEEHKSYDWVVRKQLKRTVISSYYSAVILLVLPDEVFLDVFSDAAADLKYHVYSYQWNDWKQAQALSDAINEETSYSSRVNIRLSSIAGMDQMSSLLLFIGMFISLLFFFASGSIISFKLFSDLQEDQPYYKALLRLGLSLQEIRQVVYLQIGILFLLPCLIGSVHTMFAMVTLSQLLFTNIMWPAFGIVVVYLILQYIYFLITRAVYMKQIKKRLGNLY